MILPPLDQSTRKEITVTGALEGGANFQWFGLTPPVPFSFRMEFDSHGVDLDPDPTHSLFKFQGLSVEMSFGPFTFQSNTTEIHIYSGFVVPGGKLWGPTFGSGEGFIAHNFMVDPYGIYGSFISPYLPSRIAFPTDELHWLIEGEHEIDTNSYFQINGQVHEHLLTNSQHEPGTGERVRFQDQHPTFSVATVVPEPEYFPLGNIKHVPEPAAFGLVLVGVALLLSRR